ncbi:MAG: glycosyltransferase family 39 protein, partial [Anaerolineae bacterium]
MVDQEIADPTIYADVVLSVMSSPRRLPWMDAMILLILMGLALALRLRHLGDQSLWMDEANTFSQSAGTWADVLETSRTAALDFPLERFILHPLTAYPPDEFLFRLPAALWGVLGVALTYALARQVWDRETALLAAGLLALSPYHIRYSQEARNYTSFLSLHLLSLTALVRALRRPGRRSWTLYALSVAPGLYDHLYVFLTLGIQFILHGMLCLLAMRRRELAGTFSWRSLRAHGLALLGAGMLFLPWVAFVLAGPGFLSRAGGLGGMFRAPEAIRFEPDLLLRMLCWFFENRDTAGVMFWGGLIGIIASLVISPPARRWLAWLSITYVAGIFLAVAVLSRLTGTYLAYRRLLFLQPILLLLAASGVLTALRSLWRWLARREGPPAGMLAPMA